MCFDTASRGKRGGPFLESSIGSHDSELSGMEHAMRLDEKSRNIIKREVLGVLGPRTVIRLFGSRTDDRLRGGDIDLHVETSEPIDNRVLMECALASRLFILLGGRKVDLLIEAPGLPVRSIDEQAHIHGVVL